MTYKHVLLHCLVCGKFLLRYKYGKKNISHTNIKPSNAVTCSRKCSFILTNIRMYGNTNKNRL